MLTLMRCLSPSSTEGREMQERLLHHHNRSPSHKLLLNVIKMWSRHHRSSHPCSPECTTKHSSWRCSRKRGCCWKEEDICSCCWGRQSFTCRRGDCSTCWCCTCGHCRTCCHCNTCGEFRTCGHCHCHYHHWICHYRRQLSTCCWTCNCSWYCSNSCTTARWIIIICAKCRQSITNSTCSQGR